MLEPLVIQNKIIELIRLKLKYNKIKYILLYLIFLMHLYV